MSGDALSNILEVMNHAIGSTALVSRDDLSNAWIKEGAFAIEFKHGREAALTIKMVKRLEEALALRADAKIKVNWDRGIVDSIEFRPESAIEPATKEAVVGFFDRLDVEGVKRVYDHIVEKERQNEPGRSVRDGSDTNHLGDSASGLPFGVPRT